MTHGRTRRKSQTVASDIEQNTHKTRSGQRRLGGQGVLPADEASGLRPGEKKELARQKSSGKPTKVGSGRLKDPERASEPDLERTERM